MHVELTLCGFMMDFSSMNKYRMDHLNGRSAKECIVVWDTLEKETPGDCSVIPFEEYRDSSGMLFKGSSPSENSRREYLIEEFRKQLSVDSWLVDAQFIYGRALVSLLLEVRMTGAEAEEDIVRSSVRLLGC
jgi:hypothetical protein